MIDASTETLLTLTLAAREVPGRGGRRTIDVSTIWRWTQRGIHGVRLETIKIGVSRYTSREALQRFFNATTAAADGTGSTSVRTPRQKQRDAEIAEETLDELGL